VSLQDPRILLIWDKSSDIPFFCFNPAVVSVDLDGDRRPDIAKAGHFLSVLFNRSDGTFSARNDYVVGRYPVFASRGDLDADLMPDLAVVNLESDSISVLFHKEHGEFVKGSAIPTGRNPTALAIADFEGDQRMDLAVTHQSSPFLSLHSHPTRNSGSAAPKNVDLGRGQFFVIAADLDGDGDPDLALSLRDTVEDRGDANLSVLLHQGAGEFSAPLEIRPGVSHWIEASDVNGDGELDLVSLLDNQPTLLLNSALGQFEARTVPLEFGHYPSSIRAGDLDDDGLPDLVLPSAFDFVTVLTNAGEAGFKKPSTFHLGRSVGSTSVAIADLDLDGKADLAVTNDVLNDLTLFVNLGGGSFRASNHVQLLGKPVLAVPGDFDLDNVPDLAILNDHFASVLLNRSGRFEFVASTDRSELRGYRPLASGDFDGDGRGDVALASPDALGRGGVAIASNLGAGVFGTPAEYPASFAPVQGRSADLDQDDDLDLLIVGTDGSSVLLNDGRGSLREASTYSRSGFPCQPLTDLDGDADLDLAFATGRFNEVVPFFNRGDGTFEQGTALAIADSWYLVPADLNQDGRPDLAVTTPISGQVRTIRNDGPLKFSIWNQYRVGGLPQAIARGDLDEDGDVDLAVVNGDTKDLAVLLNTGDGSFSPIHRFGAMRVVPEFIAAVDLDRDGRLDLAVLSNFLEVFPNIGEGRFGPGIRLWAGTGSSAVMADLDGNGPDDFVVSGSDGGVLFLRNKAKSLSSTDCNTNGVPDECDPDCNANGVPDFCDISAATSRDCNRNSTPDECDLQGGGSLDGNVNGVPDECDPRPLFHRGDSNTDGVFDVSDCLCTLQFLFEDGESPSCLESADANNDGRIDCSDAVFTVGFLFLGLADPPAPGPSAPCGPDTDPFGVPEDLGCGEYRPCD